MIRIISPENGRNRERGQGMSEYIIITALIACAAIGVVSAFGGVVQQQFSAMANAMKGEEASAPDITVTNGEAVDLGSWQDAASGSGQNNASGGGGG